MRIAILVPSFSEFSGDAHVAKLQAETLAKAENDVTIFAFEANIRLKDIDVVLLGMPGGSFWQRFYRLFFPLYLHKTAKWLPRLKEFDSVISHNYPMNWLACLARRFYRVNYTFWYHGIPGPQYFSSPVEKVYIRLWVWLTRLTAKNADKIASVSKFARQELKEFCGLDSEVVYNSIEDDLFHTGIDGSAIREKYALGDAPVIFNAGRLAPQKGALFLVKAFQLVKQAIPEAKLVIAGKHTFSAYSKQVRQHCDDSVIFAGQVSKADMPHYYGMCDLYATCSLWESFNLPLVEAQTCGKPVVAFDIGAHPEVIDRNGILVDAGNVEAFARACIEKLNYVVREKHR